LIWLPVAACPNTTRPVQNTNFRDNGQASVPGWPAAEIAPLFEEIAAEAERLMKISSLLTKFGREESSGL
jgi:hypothetical protein